MDQGISPASCPVKFGSNWLSGVKLKARREALRQKKKLEIFGHKASLRAFSLASLRNFLRNLSGQLIG